MTIRNIIRTPVQLGDTVTVYDHTNSIVDTFSAKALAKAYYAMSNDTFYKTYGFSYVPTLSYNTGPSGAQQGYTE